MRNTPSATKYFPTTIKGVTMLTSCQPDMGLSVTKTLGVVEVNSEAFTRTSTDARMKDVMRAAQRQCTRLGGNCILQCKVKVEASSRDRCTWMVYRLTGLVCVVEDDNLDVETISKPPRESASRVNTVPASKRKQVEDDLSSRNEARPQRKIQLKKPYGRVKR